MKWLRIAGIALAALVLLVVLLAGVLLGTAPGARFVLNAVVPAAEVANVDGRLLGPLVLEGVRYRTDAVDVRVARVRVDWRPARFLRRRSVELTVLEVDTADVTLLETETDEAGAEGDGFGPPSVPFAIRLDSVVGRSIRVVTTGNDTARAETIAMAGGAREDTFDLDFLRLRDFDYRGGRFRLDAGGRVVSGASGARDSAGLELEWEGRLDDRRVAGRGTVRGADGALAIEHRVTAPVVAALDATVRNPWTPDSLRWSLMLDVPRVALDRLRDGLQGELELSVDASGDLASAEARVTSRGDYPTLGPAALDARLGYTGDAVTIDTLRVRRLQGAMVLAGAGRIDLAGETPSVDARLGWRDLGWPLDTAAVVSPTGSMHVTGWPEDFEATADLALRQPDRPLGRWTVRVRGQYADDRVVVPELVARNEAGGRLRMTADVALEDGPRGEATVEWTELSWPPAGDSIRVASAEGRIEIRGALDDFTVRGDASLSGPAVPLSRIALDVRGAMDDDIVSARVRATGTATGDVALELDTEASYRPAGRLLVIDTLHARLPETGGVLALRGEVDVSDPVRRVSGRARWRDLVWPVAEPRYRSDEGEVTVTGRDDGVRVGADVRIGGATLPESRWRLAGQGGPDRFAVDSLRGALLGGEVLATGVVWPDSGPAWQLEVTGDTLDPGGWREEWEGRVGFAARTDGLLGEVGPSYRVTLDSLTGSLRQRPLAGGAALEGGGSGLTIDTLWVRVGGSTMEAAGTVADTLDVTWSLAAESLYDFVPGAVGEVAARGRVAGPSEAPSVTLTADGHGLTVGGWTAAELTAEADVVAGGGEPSSVAVTLRDVHGASVAVDSVAIEASGTREDHAAVLWAGSPADALEGRVEGRVADGRWHGRLDRFRLRSEPAGEWRLRDTATVTVGPDSGAIESFCWTGSGELCIAASWDADGVRWDGSGQGLPMAFLRPALPQGMIVRGQFSLETRGTTGVGPVPAGTLRVAGGAGEIGYAPDAGRPLAQPYGGFLVEAESDSSGIDARTELDLEAAGTVDARVSLPGTGPIRDRGVDGRLTVHVRDSALVSRYVAGIAESRGTADAEITVGGTVAAPVVEGTVSLEDVGATVTSAGIHLADGRLDARSTAGGRWELEAGIASDTSRLEVAGTARPPDRDSTWRLELSLEADAFPTVQTPDLVIVTSPRLDVRASPDTIRVDGRITVPRARIAVKELEGNVDVSPDVVVIGAGGEEPEQAVTPAAVSAQVQLVLGDSVRIDALGLMGRLDGRLTVEALPDRPPVGTGELQIRNGQYRIYRQTFQIDRGRLLYAGTPLANPGLDLRITRESGDVTAGMDIGGRAADPRVQLFSDPSMSDEEVLAYILVGRPLRQLSRSEGGRVQNAAQSVGVAGGNLLLARLGSVFGLETARIARTSPDEEGGRDTSLVLGRRILPRVHVNYAIGLKGTSNVLRLRYVISDHWIFQTESGGEETGVDLLYTIGQ